MTLAGYDGDCTGRKYGLTNDFFFFEGGEGRISVGFFFSLLNF